MTKRIKNKLSKIDPLESVIEAALMPGDFIDYNSTWSFISDFEAVKEQIEAIGDKDPEQAADLLLIPLLPVAMKRLKKLMTQAETWGCLLKNYFVAGLIFGKRLISLLKRLLRSLLTGLMMTHTDLLIN